MANKKIKIYESENDKELLKLCLIKLNKELFKSNNYIKHHFDNGPFFYYSCNKYPKYWNNIPHQYICILCDYINCECLLFPI